MELARLKEILARLGNVTVGVIGDYSLDAYWTLDTATEELSVETWLPVNIVTAQRYALGGASNVVANLAALGVGRIKAFAVIGDDNFGREMLDQLRRLNVDCGGIVTQEDNWDTTVFAKPYAGDDEQRRFDFGTYNAISAQSEQRLIANVEQAMGGMDALIINQQIPRGYHSDAVVAGLNRLIAAHPNRIALVDSRDKSHLFPHAILKLNAIEAARVCGEQRDVKRAIPKEDLERFAREIHSRSGRPVCVTRGERGMLVYDGARATHIPGIQILGKIDPVGSGDTTTATFAATLATGAALDEAAQIANLAAAVTVQKLKQTGTASQDEILAIGADTDYLYNPELSEDMRHAPYLAGCDIEIVNRDAPRGQFAHAVFDHDGTVSTLRQGWEAVMEPMMARAILGDAYARATEEQYHKVIARVRDYIDKSTGIQTLLQMTALVEMVREFGIVPADRILDAKGYKEIYNSALMERIRERTAKIERGELDARDFTVKGAIELLADLRARGLTLYLASGTDEEDVRREAEILGYAALFNGGVFGAVGDVTKETKKVVMDRIICDNGLSGPQLIVFGDGPVELREARKRGGVAVGVASDEIRRYGLNREKRTRLIKAGADIVIPDFSQRARLMEYLFPRS